MGERPLKDILLACSLPPLWSIHTGGCPHQAWPFSSSAQLFCLPTPLKTSFLTSNGVTATYLEFISYVFIFKSQGLLCSRVALSSLAEENLGFWSLLPLPFGMLGLEVNLHSSCAPGAGIWGFRQAGRAFYLPNYSPCLGSYFKTLIPSKSVHSCIREFSSLVCFVTLPPCTSQGRWTWRGPLSIWNPGYPPICPLLWPLLQSTRERPPTPVGCG